MSFYSKDIFGNQVAPKRQKRFAVGCCGLGVTAIETNTSTMAFPTRSYIAPSVAKMHPVIGIFGMGNSPDGIG